MRGISGGFIQVCHGKQAPLKRMHQNDGIIIYSPKLSMEGDVKCQAFTGIGNVTDENVYPFKMSDTFVPFRRSIQFTECRETSIIPLIGQLEFIPNKRSWGYPFRFGLLEINEHDFNIISTEMLNKQLHG